ncbi:uncharacterized protein JCM10292_006800 [Rhodotorula paludigena]|uniref:uncharacterized protein n=1 Tax=Rhodotorula paludigena TaxID=86838 RepID=UPI00317DEC88
MRADDLFAELCPDTTRVEWCLNPPTNGTCCGICPNGISGLGGHISLAFSSLSALAAIAVAPASAPFSLVSNLIQADAYAVSLLGYLLSDSSGLDFFHASYALMLAFSCLIPLTAIGPSRRTLFPPWAITGQKSPQERSEEAKDLVLGILDDLESSSSLRHRRRSKRISRSRLAAVIEANPELVLGEENRCSMSHIALYLGFGLSLVIWGLALYLGVLGGATGSTAVSLAQPNCTAGLGGAASLMVYANIGFMILALVVLAATVFMHCSRDVAAQLDREVTIESNSSPKLVFGVALTVWVIWMGVSFYGYFLAANANLLAAGEFSWSFSTTFSVLMLIIPCYSIIKVICGQR